MAVQKQALLVLSAMLPQGCVSVNPTSLGPSVTSARLIPSMQTRIMPKVVSIALVMVMLLGVLQPLVLLLIELKLTFRLELKVKMCSCSISFAW